MVSGKRAATLPLSIDGCVAENKTWINQTEATTYTTEISRAVPVSPTSQSQYEGYR